MMKIFSSFARIQTVGPNLRRFAALALLCLAGCTAIAGLEERTPPVASTPDAGPSADGYAIRGTVDGLEGEKVTLLLGKQFPIEVSNGPFAFPTRLSDGAPYVVEIQTSPRGHACSLEGATGYVAGADVTNVAVHCPSTNATLKGLSLSAGPITPAFASGTFAYTAGPIRTPLVVAATTTVTAETASPGARLSIQGTAATSGAPSAPVALNVAAPTPIDITVTPADPSSPAVHYTVTVVPRAYDYVKASNTFTQQQFGGATALSGDTLVVGAAGEHSNSPLVNGNENDLSLGNAGAVYVYRRTGSVWTKEAYIKATHPRSNAFFGVSVALDGDTLAVGAWGESSSASGINGDETDEGAPISGAVYVYTRSGTTWTKQAFIKPSFPRKDAIFGNAVALSGNTLAVGYQNDASAANTINGDESDTSATNAGAVYVYSRVGTTWSKQAYIKASNARAGAFFGQRVALEGDTLAVGSYGESSKSPGINGDESNVEAPASGAAYVYTRTGNTWTKQAYIKASYPRRDALFGTAVALSGNTLAVGAQWETSNATGVNGDEQNATVAFAGAVYVYTRAGSVWSKQAYVKASNTRANAFFGETVALHGDTLAVGAPRESSAAKLVDGNETDASLTDAGAVYLYKRAGTSWSKRAYVKASNTRSSALFGFSLSLSPDTLAVGSPGETSNAKLFNGNDSDTSQPNAGAVYLY